MSLIVFWILAIRMWHNVECLHVVAVNDASSRLVQVIPSVCLHGCLAVVHPKTSVREITSIGYE